METKNITELAPRFHELFAGLQESHGLYNDLAEPDTNGKRVGKDRRTIKERVTVDLWEKHLSGKSGLGICPIRIDSTTRFGAVDIDVYDGLDLKEVARKLQQQKIPLIVCRSKSGGAHVYCFTAEPVPAALMVSKLREVAVVLGHGTTEIFPKQLSLATEDGHDGNWINMPYMGGLLGMRYAIKPSDGDAMEPEEFLDAAENAQQTKKWFETPLSVSTEMPQGPPCLQHLIQIGFPPGTRNSGLYNLGVYARKLDEDNWQSLVEEYNRKYMEPPLPAEEVLGVIKSIKKKAYSYQCAAHPLAGHCNAQLCRTRKYGVGAGNGSFPELGRLAKLNTDPPLWFVDVNGKRVELTTSQLLEPKDFSKVCVEKINTNVPPVKAGDWSALITKLLAEVDILPAPEDISPEGQFWEELERFCTGRAQALNRDELLLGKPWTTGDKTYFVMYNLRQHLDRVRFKMEDNKITNILKSRGGKSEQMKLKGKNKNVWQVPAFAQQTEGHPIPQSITEEEKPF